MIYLSLEKRKKLKERGMVLFSRVVKNSNGIPYDYEEEIPDVTKMMEFITQILKEKYKAEHFIVRLQWDNSGQLWWAYILDDGFKEIKNISICGDTPEDALYNLFEKITEAKNKHD